MTLSEILSGGAGTQEDLARRLGVHPVTISKWKRVPPRDVFAPAIAEATGQPVEVVRTAIREARAGHPGAPIDTPEQTAAVLAQRGHPVAEV